MTDIHDKGGKIPDERQRDKSVDTVRNNLERELDDIRFSEAMRQSVLRRAAISFWDREVRIPLIPVIALPLLIAVAAMFFIAEPDSSPNIHVPDSTSYVVLEKGGTFLTDQLGGDWKR